jgi:hypothetical protein
MPLYSVAGEYGPQSDQSIILEIDADNPRHAKNLFCEQVELEYPSEWERMGRSNVSVVYEIKPKATPKAVEVTQPMWRVCFAHRSDMVVSAATLLGVADHVRGVCEDMRIPLKDVVRIEYLAY